MSQKVTELHPPFLGGMPYIYFSTDLIELNKVLFRKHGATFRDDPDADGWVQYKKKLNLLVMVVPPNKDAQFRLGTIQHELIHLTVQVLKCYGEKWHKAEETFCCTFEMLAEQVYEFLGVQVKFKK